MPPGLHSPSRHRNEQLLVVLMRTRNSSSLWRLTICSAMAATGSGNGGLCCTGGAADPTSDNSGIPLGEEEGSTLTASTRGRAAHCFLTLRRRRPGCIIWKAKRRGNQGAAVGPITGGGELRPWTSLFSLSSVQKPSNKSTVQHKTVVHPAVTHLSYCCDLTCFSTVYVFVDWCKLVNFFTTVQQFNS